MDTQNNDASVACTCEGCVCNTPNVKLNFAVGTVSQVALNHQAGLMSLGYDDETEAGVLFLGVGTSNKLVSSKLLDLNVDKDGIVTYSRFNGLTVEKNEFEVCSKSAVAKALSELCDRDSNIEVDVYNGRVNVNLSEVNDKVNVINSELTYRIEEVEKKIVDNDAITDINGKVQNLEELVDLQAESISSLEKYVNDNDLVVTGLVSTTESNKADIEQLRGRVNTAANDIDDLETDLVTLEAKVEVNENNISVLTEKIDSLDTILEKLDKFEKETAPKLDNINNTIDTLATKKYVDNLSKDQEFLDGISAGLNSNFVVKSELNAVSNRVAILENLDHGTFATASALEAVADRVTELESGNSGYATKEDIEELKTAINILRAQITASIAGEVDQKNVSDILGNV